MAPVMRVRLYTRPRGGEGREGHAPRDILGGGAGGRGVADGPGDAVRGVEHARADVEFVVFERPVGDAARGVCRGAERPGDGCAGRGGGFGPAVAAEAGGRGEDGRAGKVAGFGGFVPVGLRAGVVAFAAQEGLVGVEDEAVEGEEEALKPG